MPQIIPMKDLRETTKLAEKCHSVQEPIFVTKNGYGDLVVMSMETYDSLLKEHHIDRAIAASEAELAAGGQPLEAASALEKLRRKHFGKV